MEKKNSDEQEKKIAIIMACTLFLVFLTSVILVNLGVLPPSFTKYSPGEGYTSPPSQEEVIK